jgi:hypothetical protein
MPKRKLLVVVGAGASMDFGMPSTAALRDVINGAIIERYPLAFSPMVSLYERIESIISQYWKDSVPATLRREINFEDVLYAIFALAAAYPSGAYTSAVAALFTPVSLPDVSIFGSIVKRADKHVLRELACAAVDAIANHFRRLSVSAQTRNTKEFTLLESFFKSLNAEFDIAVVTLNYDDVMYRAVPGAETGFNPANLRFEESRIINRAAWPCMLHLHGSVHFDMPQATSPYGIHEICWQPDLNHSFQNNSTGRNGQQFVEGPYFPTSTIVAGYGKTSQVLRRPFRTYYSELDRLVVNCDAVLFAGYGFGDAHLNLAFETFRDERRRPVVVVDFASDNQMTAAYSAHVNFNPAIKTLLHTFRTDPRSMRSLGHTVPTTVANLRATLELELSDDPKTPLAIWYHGMLDACSNPDKFINRLV